MTAYQLVMALGLGGTLIMIIKWLPTKLFETLYMKNSTKVYVNNSSSADYNGLLKWLKTHDIDKHIESYQLTNSSDICDIAPGNYWFLLSNTCVCTIKKESEKKDFGSPLEKIYVTIIGFNRYAYYKEIIDIVNKEKGTNTIQIHKTNNIYNSTNQPKRNLDSIFLNGNIVDNIKQQLDEWIINKNEYENKGITYKTGFLLYGPPGTGKTSLAKAIASYTNLPLISIKEGNDIENVISQITTKKVIFFDDIDVLIDNMNSNCSKFTYDRLLSFVDGIDSPSNSIFIFATNKLEVLPESLLRCGRIDHKHYIGHINNDVAYKMCKFFGLTDDITKVIIDDGTDTKSQSYLQQKIFESKYIYK